MRNIFLSSFLSFVFFSLGCSSGGGSDDGNDNGQNTTANSIFSVGTTAAADGTASARFDIPEGVTKFAVTAEVSGTGVQMTSIADQRGNQYLTPGGLALSFATFLNSGLGTANVPSRNLDPALATPGSFLAALYTGASLIRPASGKEITLTIVTSNDQNFSEGTLRLNIFYVGEVASNAATKSIFQRALEEAKKIYANAATITVLISEFDSAGPMLLPPPFEGSSFYSTLAASVPFPAVNVFVGSDIEGIEGSALGVASSIPGPPYPTPKSAVSISMITGAGIDGVYSDEEIRVLGETVAHEVGHFLGLFHPVETTSVLLVLGEDPLSDTPSCTFVSECFENEDLTSNLMFPSPVRSRGGGLVRQDRLTGQQKAVMNRYAGVS